MRNWMQLKIDKDLCNKNVKKVEILRQKNTIVQYRIFIWGILIRHVCVGSTIILQKQKVFLCQSPACRNYLKYDKPYRTKKFLKNKLPI